MQPPKDQPTTDLLEELNQTVKAIGLPGTIAILRNSREQVNPDETIRFVVVSVCNQLKITIQDLLQSNGDTVKYAKGFIIYYLRNDFKIQWAEIKVVMNHRNQSWLWTLKRSIDKLKPNLSAHASWCEAKHFLDNIISEYKSKSISNPS